MFAVDVAFRLTLHVFHVKHQAQEFFFEEPDFPGVVRTLQILKIIVTVDIDQIKLHVSRVVLLLEKELVQLFIRSLFHISPDDQHLLTGWIRALYD